MPQLRFPRKELNLRDNPLNVLRPHTTGQHRFVGDIRPSGTQACVLCGQALDAGIHGLAPFAVTTVHSLRGQA